MAKGAMATGVFVAALMSCAPRFAAAHCDTMDGPVVKDAQAALEARDVRPALKWVKAEQEAEVREAFRHVLAVRALGPEARALGDRFFFETLVRLHREAEGAAYTGLKPAGTEVEPGIAEADQAIESGSADALVKGLAAHLEDGVRARFGRVREARAHAGESVARGRAYVAAYVDFVHYVERVHGDLAGDAPHDAHAEGLHQPSP